MAVNDFGLTIAEYNASLPTLADGEKSELQVDVNGRLLVQADVTVLVDFLGLNGAANNANILIVGTEDGTGTGTAHAIRVAADGAVAIQDNGGSITVDAVNLDIRDLVYTQDSVTAHQGGTWTIDSITNPVTVQATDLDIRDLSHTQDSIKIGDGVDFLAVNADGSINVNATVVEAGTFTYGVTDALVAAADGLIGSIAATYVDVATISVGAGQIARIYGWQWAADGNADAQLVSDDGTDVKVYKLALNSTAMPTYSEHFSEGGRIEIAGSATMTVKVRIRRRGAAGSLNGTGSIHARLV